MKSLTKKQNIAVVLSLIILGAMARLLPHPPNFTPIAGIALLGAAYIGKKHLALILPLAILFISDLLINNTFARAFYPEEQGLIIFQEYMVFVYLGFILTVLIGFGLRRKIGVNSLLQTTILASLVFFLLTNFGVWLQGLSYPKTFSGLLLCYEMALPFFLNSLLGNVFFVGVLFGAYHLIMEHVITTDKKNRASIS